jgi:hypothetical protein
MCFKFHTRGSNVRLGNVPQPQRHVSGECLKVGLANEYWLL